MAAFPLTELPLDDAPLEVARGSFERTGLFLLGETHGIAETASAILSLVRRLDVRALALEWSYDEVDEIVQGVFVSGRIDLDALWEISIGGDLFASDGRFTAGHVAVIEHLVRADQLEQLILVDRLGGGWPTQDDREEALASRLLAGLRPSRSVLAVPGCYHAARELNAARRRWRCGSSVRCRHPRTACSSSPAVAATSRKSSVTSRASSPCVR